MNKSNFYYLLLIAGMLVSALAKTYGQDKEIPKELYKASSIPDSLKENANSVVRYAIEEDNVTGPGKLTEQHHTIVTILNEKDDREATISLPYIKKLSFVNSFEMKVYNADGVLLKKYHKSDMYDHAAIDNESIITDDRVLSIGHDIASYPVTIEMIYEIDTKSGFDLGGWYIQRSEQSVQNSYYRLSINSDAGFRYLDKNTTVKPEKTTNNNFDSYSWQVFNLKASKLEDGAESWRVLPRVYFAASKFDQYGYPGDISTWQNYGKWQKDLNADVCSLTPEREAEIRKMTDTIKTDKAKAKFLYNYMQQNVRYVSVQLGIGGWKPFAASFVDQKKYGDCKALSNYMSALLKAVGIRSCYAVINAEPNMEPADPSFPFDYFNHVILCIPFKSDTTWLECTSSTQQFGVLGSFTENRNALIVDEDGGKLVRTPRSVAEENQLNSEIHIQLDADGGAKAQIKMLSTGEIRRIFMERLPRYKADKQKEYLENYFAIKQPSAFDFRSDKDFEGTKEVNLNLEYDKYCDVKAGDKQFYRSQIFSLWSETEPVLEKRKTDFFFEFPLLETSTTTIDLPAGFEVETLPVNQSLKFTYGNYDIKYVYDATKNQVVSTAKFTLSNHVIPAAKYTEMQQYLDAVAKAQNKKLVIRRKA